MKIESINKALNGIVEAVNQIKYTLLHNPLGIRITIIHRDGLSLVEYWNGEQAAIPIGICPEKIPFNVLTYWIFQALGMIPISSVDKDYIEIVSDVHKDDLDPETKKAIEVLNIRVYRETDSDIINLLEEKYAIDRYRQRDLQEQKTN